MQLLKAVNKNTRNQEPVSFKKAKKTFKIGIFFLLKDYWFYCEPKIALKNSLFEKILNYWLTFLISKSIINFLFFN